MNVNKLTEVLVSTGITLALSSTVVGCGSQNLTKEKRSQTEKTTESQSDQQDKSKNSSLSLATPGDLPADVDEVEISLSRVTMSVEVNKNDLLPVTYLFTLDGQPIQIKDLEAGDYWITVTYKNGATGSVYSTGQGHATVEVGKLATAHVAMKKVNEGTGGLVIVPQDGNLVCPAIAKAPVCIRKKMNMVVAPSLTIGGCAPIFGCEFTPRPYSFKRKPNSCEYKPLPDDFTIVPDSECDGMSLGHWDSVDAILSSVVAA